MWSPSWTSRDWAVIDVLLFGLGHPHVLPHDWCHPIDLLLYILDIFDEGVE